MADKSEPKDIPSVPAPILANFYRDRYRTLWLCLITLIVAVIAMGFLLIGLLIHRPNDIYFPADVTTQENLAPADSGFNIVPRTPMNKPNMTDSQLYQWLYSTIIASFSYDSQYFSRTLEGVKFHYTDTAWEQLNDILTNMYDFSTLTSNQALVTVVHPLEAPIIEDQGNDSGVYAWQFTFPVEVQFAGSIIVPAQSMDLKINVIRTSMKNDVYGLKINAIEATNIKRRRTSARTPGIF